MKKKVLIILGIVIILLLVIYGVIFLIDYNNISKGKLPIFAIKSDTENYKGLGYSVKVKYYKDTNSIEKIEMFAFGKTVAEALCSYAGENNDLTYMQRKDMGVKQIAKINQFDNTDFEVYTLGGDVTITIEQDMVYSLEEALNQKIITVNSILEQAKLDEEYGICETAFYKDGESTEYRYKDYTILKFNTLDGNKDLIIGMSDSIINNESLKNNYRVTEKCN